MHRVVCTAFGPIDHLTIEEVPDPAVEPGTVLIAVRATGVNYVDALMVTGKYQLKPPLPFVPGSEIAGEIIAVGPNVTARRVGERVMVTSGMGGFADRFLAPANAARPVPAGLTDGQAATFVQSYGTMHYAFTRRTTLAAGEWVLVLGAGGGVGLAAVDLARQRGARVIAAASSDTKLAAARAAGAEATVNYATEDLKTRVRELSGGGVDLVIDPVGGELAEPALRTLRPFGRYLVLGFVGGIPRLPANFILLLNRTVIGIDWGGWAYADRDASQRTLDDLFALAATGALRPAEPTAYPMTQVHRALADLQARRVTGKLTLTP